VTRTTASRFERNIGEYKDRAKHEPVEITQNGKREWVLLSADQYDWLVAAHRRAYRVVDLPKSVVDAIAKSKMDPRYDYLNALLDE